ncbi:MAG: hypothetical protein DWG80_04075 [Chloroflexi bacterium]|nr:hypothetical protein [Chloroflexota bacterium]
MAIAALAVAVTAARARAAAVIEARDPVAVATVVRAPAAMAVVAADAAGRAFGLLAWLRHDDSPGAIPGCSLAPAF